MTQEAEKSKVLKDVKKLLCSNVISRYLFSVSLNCLVSIDSGFWRFLRVLEGLKRSGRLVGSISTYPGT